MVGSGIPNRSRLPISTVGVPPRGSAAGKVSTSHLAIRLAASHRDGLVEIRAHCGRVHAAGPCEELQV